MKMMRYRIRVITLVLICLLFAVILFLVKSAWFRNVEEPETHLDSFSVSSSIQPASWADPTPDLSETKPDLPKETVSPAAEAPSASPAPLFDTTGL